MEQKVVHYQQKRYKTWITKDYSFGQLCKDAVSYFGLEENRSQYLLCDSMGRSYDIDALILGTLKGMITKEVSKLMLVERNLKSAKSELDLKVQQEEIKKERKKIKSPLQKKYKGSGATLAVLWKLFVCHAVIGNACDNITHLSLKQFVCIVREYFAPYVLEKEPQEAQIATKYYQAIRRLKQAPQVGMSFPAFCKALIMQAEDWMQSEEEINLDTILNSMHFEEPLAKYMILDNKLCTEIREMNEMLQTLKLIGGPLKQVFHAFNEEFKESSRELDTMKYESFRKFGQMLRLNKCFISSIDIVDIFMLSVDIDEAILAITSDGVEGDLTFSDFINALIRLSFLVHFNRAAESLPTRIDSPSENTTETPNHGSEPLETIIESSASLFCNFFVDTIPNNFTEPFFTQKSISFRDAMARNLKKIKMKLSIQRTKILNSNEIKEIDETKEEQLPTSSPANSFDGRVTAASTRRKESRNLQQCIEAHCVQGRKYYADACCTLLESPNNMSTATYMTCQGRHCFLEALGLSMRHPTNASCAKVSLEWAITSTNTVAKLFSKWFGVLVTICIPFTLENNVDCERAIEYLSPLVAETLNLYVELHKTMEENTFLNYHHAVCLTQNAVLMELSGISKAKIIDELEKAIVIYRQLIEKKSNTHLVACRYNIAYCLFMQFHSRRTQQLQNGVPENVFRGKRGSVTVLTYELAEILELLQNTPFSKLYKCMSFLITFYAPGSADKLIMKLYNRFTNSQEFADYVYSTNTLSAERIKVDETFQDEFSKEIVCSVLETLSKYGPFTLEHIYNDILPGEIVEEVETKGSNDSLDVATKRSYQSNLYRFKQLPNFGRLVDYVAVVGHGPLLEHEEDFLQPEDALFRPILYDITPSSHEEFNIPENLGLFCFPKYVSLSSEAKEDESNNFILTDAKGNLIYVTSYTFWEKLSKTALISMFATRHDEDFPEETSLPSWIMDESKQVYSPKAICIVSHYYFLGQFTSLLKRLCHIGKHSDASILKFADAIIYDLPLPDCGDSDVVCNVSPDKFVHFRRPSFDQLPMLYTPLTPLFQALPHERIIDALTFLLCEQKVALLSKNVTLLTPVMEGLRALLCPFNWQLPYIPVMPVSLFDDLNGNNALADFLSSPMSFLVGFDSTEISLDLFEDVYVIDIDSGDLYGHPNEVRYPDKARRKLLSGLKDADSMEKDSFWESNVRSLFLTTTIQSFQHANIKNLRVQNGEIKFDQETFLTKTCRSASREEVSFYKQVIQTLHFNQFLNEIMTPSHNTARLFDAVTRHASRKDRGKRKFSNFDVEMENVQTKYMTIELPFHSLNVQAKKYRKPFPRFHINYFSELSENTRSYCSLSKNPIMTHRKEESVLRRFNMIRRLSSFSSPTKSTSNLNIQSLDFTQVTEESEEEDSIIEQIPSSPIISENPFYFNPEPKDSNHFLNNVSATKEDENIEDTQLLLSKSLRSQLLHLLRKINQDSKVLESHTN